MQNLFSIFENHVLTQTKYFLLVVVGWQSYMLLWFVEFSEVWNVHIMSVTRWNASTVMLGTGVLNELSWKASLDQATNRGIITTIIHAGFVRRVSDREILYAEIIYLLLIINIVPMV